MPSGSSARARSRHRPGPRRGYPRRRERPSGPIGKRKGGNETETATTSTSTVDGRGRRLPVAAAADDDVAPAQGGVDEQESGAARWGGRDPGARRTAISKMRKHELIEELTERGMDAGGVVKELRDRLRAAREVGGWRGDE